MKYCSPRLAAHLAQPDITVAFLWKVVRTDGVIIGYTDHDQPIIYTDDDSVGATVTYAPNEGATGSAIENSGDMSVSNQELTGFLLSALDSPAITEKDIIAGKYDWAVIELRLVNWADLTMGDLEIKKCTMGNVKLQNGEFKAELRGLEFYLGTNIGETYGPPCRADLGDSRCTVNLANYAQDGSITSVSDLRTFVPPANSLKMVGSSTPTTPAPAAWFAGGVVTWLTGANATYGMEVSSWDGTTIELFENMPNPIAVTDTYSITPGCNKTSQDCQGKFNNIANQRGEEFIPGIRQVSVYPNADGSIPGS